jgi:hypothetical protein
VSVFLLECACDWERFYLKDAEAKLRKGDNAAALADVNTFE